MIHGGIAILRNVPTALRAPIFSVPTKANPSSNSTPGDRIHSIYVRIPIAKGEYFNIRTYSPTAVGRGNGTSPGTPHQDWTRMPRAGEGTPLRARRSERRVAASAPPTPRPGPESRRRSRRPASPAPGDPRDVRGMRATAEYPGKPRRAVVSRALAGRGSDCQ